jgi:hypothetical protein
MYLKTILPTIKYKSPKEMFWYSHIYILSLPLAKSDYLKIQSENTNQNPNNFYTSLNKEANL